MDRAFIVTIERTITTKILVPALDASSARLQIHEYGATEAASDYTIVDEVVETKIKRYIKER